MQEWIIIAVLGLVIGATTFAVVPGKVRGGIFLAMLVGGVGALAMTWIARQVGLGQVGRFLVAVAGTTLIMALWRGIMGRGDAGPE